jgi:hypothetical protein
LFSAFLHKGRKRRISPYIARQTAAQIEIEVKDAFGTAVGGGASRRP